MRREVEGRELSIANRVSVSQKGAGIFPLVAGLSKAHL